MENFFSLQIFFLCLSALGFCIEADFLIRLSKRKKRVLYYPMYIFALFVAERITNCIYILLKFPPDHYRIASYLGAFAGRFFFAVSLLKMHRTAAASSGMILVVLKLLAENFSGLLLTLATTFWIRYMPGAVNSRFFFLLPLPILLTQIPFLFIMLRLIYRRYWPGNSRQPVAAGYLHILLLPSVLLIFSLEQNINGTVTDVQPGYVIMETQSKDTLEAKSLFASVLTCAVFLVTLSGYRKTNDFLDAEKEKASLLGQIEAQKKYVAEAGQRFETYRSFRHDIRNHFLTLSGLIQGGKTNQALNYLQKLNGGTAGVFFPASSGNPVIDVLLAEKLSYAKNCGIAVSCRISSIETIAVEDFDLCIVLGNLLDNAIAAARKADVVEPYIDIALIRKEDFLFLEISNGHARYDTVAEGLGLRNVRKTLRKYDGTLSIEYGENGIAVGALLCLPPSL